MKLDMHKPYETDIFSQNSFPFKTFHVSSVLPVTIQNVNSGPVIYLNSVLPPATPLHYISNVFLQIKTHVSVYIFNNLDIYFLFIYILYSILHFVFQSYVWHIILQLPYKCKIHQKVKLFIGNSG